MFWFCNIINYIHKSWYCYNFTLQYKRQGFRVKYMSTIHLHISYVNQYKYTHVRIPYIKKKTLYILTRQSHDMTNTARLRNTSCVPRTVLFSARSWQHSSQSSPSVNMSVQWRKKNTYKHARYTNICT